MRLRTLLLVGVLTVGSFATVAHAEPQKEKVIVVFDSSVAMDDQAAIIEAVGGQVKNGLDIINATAAKLTADERETLAADARVIRIDEDAPVYVAGRTLPSPPAPQPAQTLEWNIDRVDAELANTAGNSGSTVKICIVDSGIDKTHPDLQANIKGGYRAISGGSTSNYSDDLGHGTMVSGLVAALNNTIGIRGVSPAAHMYAVKVFNYLGQALQSDIIEGISWCRTNAMQVVNMSFTTIHTQSLHDTIIAAYNSGLSLIAAAGNTQGAEITYPALYPEVLAVSATTRDETRPLYGPVSALGQIDIAAPGGGYPTNPVPDGYFVRTTVMNGGYGTGNGTSLAAPHVAGAAALVIKSPLSSSGTNWDLNSNGRWDPAEVYNKLKMTAEDIGTPGFDNEFGYGLLDAERAAQ